MVTDLGKVGDILSCILFFFFNLAKKRVKMKYFPFLLFSCVMQTPAGLLHLVLFGYFYTRAF